MRCPYCGDQHPDQTYFCPKTGKTLNQPDVCQNCGASLPPEVKFCPVCGTEINVTVSSKINSGVVQNLKRPLAKPVFVTCLSLLVILFSLLLNEWNFSFFTPLSTNSTITLLPPQDPTPFSTLAITSELSEEYGRVLTTNISGINVGVQTFPSLNPSNCLKWLGSDEYELRRIQGLKAAGYTIDTNQCILFNVYNYDLNASPTNDIYVKPSTGMGALFIDSEWCQLNNELAHPNGYICQLIDYYSPGKFCFDIRTDLISEAKQICIDY